MKSSGGIVVGSSPCDIIAPIIFAIRSGGSSGIPGIAPIPPPGAAPPGGAGIPGRGGIPAAPPPPEKKFCISSISFF